MASRSPRRKAELEPISIDELLTGAGMSGFVSILQPPDAVPHLQRLVDEIRDTEVVSEPVVEKDTVVEKESASLPAPDPTHKVRYCASAHDGHSLGEEALYQALWNAKMARFETKDTRLVTAGWKVMSAIARLTPRNTKNNCQSLIEKLALELVSGENSAERIGRTYRVYSPKAILDRRKAAGLEWVIRTRGVRFVEAPSGGAVSERDTVVKKDREPMYPQLSALLRSRVGSASITRQLMAACRANAPDATEQEVVRFTAAKLEIADKVLASEDPVAFVLATVPRCFQGAAFERYRAAAREEDKRLAREFVASLGS